MTATGLVRDMIRTYNLNNYLEKPFGQGCYFNFCFNFLVEHLIRLLAWHSKFINAKRLKKISKELMPTAWHPKK